MRLRPVARASERALQCVAPAGVVSNVDDDLFDLGVGHGARCARPWLIAQPVDPVRGEACPPLADGCRRQAHASGERLVAPPRRAAKHDTRSTRQLRSGARPPSHQGPGDVEYSATVTAPSMRTRPSTMIVPWRAPEGPLPGVATAAAPVDATGAPRRPDNPFEFCLLFYPPRLRRSSPRLTIPGSAVQYCAFGWVNRRTHHSPTIGRHDAPPP